MDPPQKFAQEHSTGGITRIAQNPAFLELTFRALVRLDNRAQHACLQQVAIVYMKFYQGSVELVKIWAGRQTAEAQKETITKTAFAAIEKIH